jgi:hypothetical protein
MKKLFGLLLGTTRVGKAAKKVQKYLDGKKQLLTGLIGAIPATLLIIQKFQEGGIEYILKAAESPEYAAALLGWGLVWNAVKGEKIRHENAEKLES